MNVDSFYSYSNPSDIHTTAGYLSSPVTNYSNTPRSSLYPDLQFQYYDPKCVSSQKPLNSSHDSLHHLANSINPCNQPPIKFKRSYSNMDDLTGSNSSKLNPIINQQLEINHDQRLNQKLYPDNQQLFQKPNVFKRRKLMYAGSDNNEQPQHNHNILTPARSYSYNNMVKSNLDILHDVSLQSTTNNSDIAQFGNSLVRHSQNHTDNLSTNNCSNDYFHNTTQTQKFIYSRKTYTISKPFADHEIQSLLENPAYGGPIIISRKRKQTRVDTTISQFSTPEELAQSKENNINFQLHQIINCKNPNWSIINNINTSLDYTTVTSSTIFPQSPPISSPSLKADNKKVSQGRPYSTEMEIEVVFPTGLDNLYSILCEKGVSPPSFKVKLQSNTTTTTATNNNNHNNNSDVNNKKSTRKKKKSDNQIQLKTIKKFYKKSLKTDKAYNYPIFGDSLEMVKYFTNTTNGFSLVTPIRQSSTQKIDTKKGTCPVVKFSLTPVTDYSIQFLKKMAYPRYKAEMKMYIVPYKVDQIRDYYTSPMLFLQDLAFRSGTGMEWDASAQIFSSSNWPDLPKAVYHDQTRQSSPTQNQYCNKERKASLNFILN